MATTRTNGASAGAAATEPIEGQQGTIRSDRLVVIFSMVMAVRPLRGTSLAPLLSALLLATLIFLAIDGARRGWLFTIARRVDRLMWVAMAWAVAVIAITGPGADLTTIMVSFFFGTLLACRIAACQRPTETLALSLVAVIAISALLTPLQTADQTLGATWAYEHSHAAGRVLGLAAVVVLGRCITIPRGRFHSLYLLSGLVAVAMVFRTDSGTVLLAIASSIVFLWFNRRRRPDVASTGSPLLPVAVILTVVAIGVLVVGIVGIDPGATAGALGRSSTNNTAIVRFGLWADGLTKIAERPFFGYGYTPYDRGELVFSSGGNDVRDFDPTNLHNSYLQLAYSFGVAFALFTVGHTFRRMWQNYQAGMIERSALALCMALFGLAYSVFFAGSPRASYYWALSMWAIYIAPQWLLDKAAGPGSDAGEPKRSGRPEFAAKPRELTASVHGGGAGGSGTGHEPDGFVLGALDDSIHDDVEFAEPDLIVSDASGSPRHQWPPLPPPIVDAITQHGDAPFDDATQTPHRSDPGGP